MNAPPGGLRICVEIPAVGETIGVDGETLAMREPASERAQIAC